VVCDVCCNIWRPHQRLRPLSKGGKAYRGPAAVGAETQTPNNPQSSIRILMVAWDTDSGGAGNATRNIYQSVSRYCLDQGLPYEFRLRTVKGLGRIDKHHEIGVAPVGRLFYLAQKYRWLLRRGLRHIILREPSFLLTTADIDTGLGQEILQRKPDLVHLFWLGNRTLSIREIGLIQKAGIPIVWTMSDCWPVSGVHHYPPIKETGKIPDPQYRKSLRAFRKVRAQDARTFRAKKKFWSKPISLVVKSSWLAQRAQSSAISRGWPITMIPNPFHMTEVARLSGRIPNRGGSESAVRLGFGFLGKAAERKGEHVVIAALELISELAKEAKSPVPMELVLFGDANVPRAMVEAYGFGYRNVGRVPREEMFELYESLDILLAPSLQDNSPNIASEAVAHGIPVVAFEGTGLSDVVITGVTGVTVPKGDVLSFSEATAQLVVDETFRFTLSERASRFAAQNWSPETVAAKYLDVYQLELGRNL